VFTVCSAGSVGGVYLLGDAALLDYDLSQHFSACLKQQGFSQLTCPDMMKSLVLVCGVKSVLQVYTMK
jgi:hypothetical protein